MTSRQQDDKRQMNNSPIGNELSRESLIQTVRLPILTAVSTDASVVDGRNATIKDSFLNFDSRKFWWNENSASIASTWQVGTNCLCYIYRYRQSVVLYQSVVLNFILEHGTYQCVLERGTFESGTLLERGTLLECGT